SGRVDGNLWGQFQMSEQDGFVRVSTTQDRFNWWEENPDPVSNNVFVLAGEEDLQVVGQVRDIAVGESLWATRFAGDKAYLVTFQSIDPLWTVDLSDPANPTLLSELEVPGVSTYIHPIDGDNLLTIGYGSDEEWGIDWSTSISLFDVSDPTAPSLTDTL